MVDSASIASSAIVRRGPDILRFVLTRAPMYSSACELVKTLRLG
jgi:hypothetical protein